MNAKGIGRKGGKWTSHRFGVISFGSFRERWDLKHECAPPWMVCHKKLWVTGERQQERERLDECVLSLRLSRDCRDQSSFVASPVLPCARVCTGIQTIWCYLGAHIFCTSMLSSILFLSFLGEKEKEPITRHISSIETPELSGRKKKRVKKSESKKKKDERKRKDGSEDHRIVKYEFRLSLASHHPSQPDHVQNNVHYAG